MGWGKGRSRLHRVEMRFHISPWSFEKREKIKKMKKLKKKKKNKKLMKKKKKKIKKKKIKKKIPSGSFPLPGFFFYIKKMFALNLGITFSRCTHSNFLDLGGLPL